MNIHLISVIFHFGVRSTKERTYERKGLVQRTYLLGEVTREPLHLKYFVHTPSLDIEIDIYLARYFTTASYIIKTGLIGVTSTIKLLIGWRGLNLGVT